MVLAPEYSNNKNKKDSIETVMNLIEFPSLDALTRKTRAQKNLFLGTGFCQ